MCIIDVATIEAIACREGLSLADDLMLQNVIIAMNSKQVINDIERVSRGGYGASISEIRQRSSLNCIFSFESRTVNSDADRLTKFFHYLDLGRYDWFVEPHSPFCIPHHLIFSINNKAWFNPKNTDQHARSTSMCKPV